MRMTKPARWIFYVAGVMLLACVEKKSQENVSEGATTETTTNELPAMEVRLVDGSKLNVKTLTGETILVLFQPDCEHCQNEARQIRENLEAFRNYDMYFISSVPMPEIRKFADDYGLSGHDNVQFGATPLESVLDNFGAIQAPSMYIYEDGKLKQQLSGEVDISVITKYL